MLAYDDGTAFLRRADALRKAGDRAGAVREYLAYIEHVNRLPAQAMGELRRVRLLVVRRQVLALEPARLDVRRALADDYAALGMTDAARRELQRSSD